MENVLTPVSNVLTLVSNTEVCIRNRGDCYVCMKGREFLSMQAVVECIRLLLKFSSESVGKSHTWPFLSVPISL